MIFSADERKPGWWSQTGSNRRPPACKAGALPTELWPRAANRRPSRVRRSSETMPGQEERMADPATRSEKQQEHDAHGPGADVPKPAQRAEVSNYEIVRHHFGRAAENLGLAD